MCHSGDRNVLNGANRAFLSEWQEFVSGHRWFLGVVARRTPDTGGELCQQSAQRAAEGCGNGTATGIALVDKINNFSVDVTTACRPGNVAVVM